MTVASEREDAGPVAAFFDIDRTVLEVNSGSRWITHMWRTGRMTAWELTRAAGWLAQYHFGLLDFEAMLTKSVAAYAGQSAEPITIEVAEWFAAEIEATICVQARERVHEHKRRGHIVALLTSATRFLSEPLAHALDIQHILCTEIEIVDGIITGRHQPPACYGPGKVVRAEWFAAEHGIDLDRSFFYTDSVSDLPMLERVGEPRVVNPDPRLRRHARERGWGFETWCAPRLAATRTRDEMGQR